MMVWRKPPRSVLYVAIGPAQKINGQVVILGCLRGEYALSATSGTNSEIYTYGPLVIGTKRTGKTACCSTFVPCFCKR